MDTPESVKGSSNDAPHSEDKTPPVAGPGAHGYLCGECNGQLRLRNSLNVYKTCSLCKEKRGMHPSCLRKHLAKEGKDHNTTPENWQADTDLLLWCVGCETGCFVCTKKKKKKTSRGVRHVIGKNPYATKVLCSKCKVKWCVMLNAKEAELEEKDVGKCCGHVTKDHNFKCPDCSSNDQEPTINMSGMKRTFHANKMRPFNVEQGTSLSESVVLSIKNVYKNESKDNHKYSLDRPTPLEMDQCNCHSVNDSQKCLDTNCINYATYYECSDDCELQRNCSNDRLKKFKWKELIVCDSKTDKGLMVLTRDFIKENDLVCEYTGVVINSKLLDNEDMNTMSYCIGNADIMVDAEHIGSVARYINHSCDPNCVVVPWIVDGYHRLGIFSKRNINPREELTFDYKWESKSGGDKINCLCGSNICRTTVHSYNKYDFGWIYLTDEGKWHKKSDAPITNYWKIVKKSNEKPNNPSAIHSGNDDATWQDAVNSTINSLWGEFNVQIEKDTDLNKAILLVIRALKDNVRSCDGKTKKGVYKFVTDLCFVPITNVEGFEKGQDSDQGNEMYLHSTYQSLLWIAAHEVFGTQPLPVKPPHISYDTNPVALTHLGNMMFNKFGTDPKCHKEFTANTMYGDGDDVPHQVIQKFKNKKPDMMKNKDLEVTGTFLKELFDVWHEGKIMTSVDEIFLETVLRFTYTKPESFSLNNDGRVPESDMSFIWKVVVNLLGSRWDKEQEYADGEDPRPSDGTHNKYHYDTNAKLIRTGEEEGALSGGMQYDILSVNDDYTHLGKVVRKPFYEYVKHPYEPPVARRFVSRLFYHFLPETTKQIYEFIEEVFGLGDKEMERDYRYNSFDKCEHELTQEFSHLDVSEHNIFSMNQMNGQHESSLYLSVMSLMRLIGKQDDGQIDDNVLNFVAEMLNFYATFEPKLKVESKKEPKVLFLSTYDDVLHINPMYAGAHYKKLSAGKRYWSHMNEEDTNLYKSELKSWYYSTNYSDLCRFFWIARERKWTLKKICGCIRKGKLKYLSLKIDMPLGEKEWLVETKGSDKGHQNCVEASESRIFYAKYITLKREEMESRPLSFDMDNVLKANPTGEDHKVKHTASLASIWHADSTEGIAVINEWLHELRGEGVSEKLNCDELRQCIFQLIMKVYYLINENEDNYFRVPDDYLNNQNYHDRLQDVAVVLSSFEADDWGGIETFGEGVYSICAGSAENYQEFLEKYSNLVSKMSSKEAQEYVEKREENEGKNARNDKVKTGRTKQPNRRKGAGKNETITLPPRRDPPVPQTKTIVLGNMFDRYKINRVTTSKVKFESNGSKIKLLNLLKFFVKSNFKLNESLKRNKNPSTLEKKKKIKPLHEYIDKCLERNTTYFILRNVMTKEYKAQKFGKEDFGNLTGLKNNELHPQIIAVMNVEKLIMVRTKKCSLIHFLCVHPKFRSMHHGALLLSKVYDSGVFKDHRVYANQFLRKEWIPIKNDDKTSRESNSKRPLFASSFFFRFRFESNKVARYEKWERCDDLETLVPENTSYVWIEASNLQNICNRYLKLEKDMMDNRIVEFFECCPDEKTLLIYKHDTKKFRVFNPVYGWIDAQRDLLRTIAGYKKSQAKNNKGGAVPINISGYRKTHSTPYEGAAGIEIPDNFRQSSFTTDSNCVYLSAAIAMYFDNHEQEALKMLNNIEQNPVLYDDMRFFSGNKRTNQTYCLREALEVDNSGYCLQRVKKKAGVTNQSRLDYVLSCTNDGVFLALLEDDTGSTTHTVGVNLRKRELYDCMEQQVMRLSRENLSYCCGPNCEIVGIEVLAEMKVVPKKQVDRKRKYSSVTSTVEIEEIDDRKPSAK